MLIYLDIKIPHLQIAHQGGNLEVGNIKIHHLKMDDCQVENLIICNCPHPIAMKTNQRENWRQMVKSWYMVFFQVNKYNDAMMVQFLIII